MTTDLLRKILPESGYAVSFRSDEWTECLAEREAERWRGRGLNEDDALEDVLRQMLPSTLARGLLERLPSSDAASASAAESAPGPVSDNAASAPAGEEAHVDPPDPGPSSANNTDPSTPNSSGNGTPTANSAPGANSSRIRVAAKTDRGLIRERNEDACLALPERGLVAVTDGLGAHAAGDVASTMAIETLRKAFEGKEALSPVRIKALPRLVAAIEPANAEVFNAGRRDPARRGMGTTIAAVLIVGRQVVLGRVCKPGTACPVAGTGPASATVYG